MSENTFTFTSEQRKMVEDLKENLGLMKGVFLKAPTDWGKTAVYLDAALSFHCPVTVLVSTYEGVEPVLEGLKNLGVLRKLCLVLPMGKVSIRNSFCASRDCKGCDKKRRGKLPTLKGKIKGNIINGSWVIENYPDWCPYTLLKHWVNEGMADVVITHWRMFTESNIKTEGVLVIDEVDRPLEPRSFPMCKYELATGGIHLETSRQKNYLDRLVEITEKMSNKPPYFYDRDETAFYIRRIEVLQSVLKWLIEEFKKSPPYWEVRSIKRGYETANPDTDITDEETWQYGIFTARGMIKNKANDWKHAIKSIFRETPELNKFSNSDFINLNQSEINLMYAFFHVLKHNPEIFVKEVNSSPALDGKGYVEVHAVTRSHELEELLDRYEKVILATATAPAYTPPEFNVSEVEDDPMGDKKLVVLLPSMKETKKLTNLLLSRFNVLGIAASYYRMKKACKYFGGLTIGSRHGRFKYDFYLREAVNLCEYAKNYLLWGHYGSLSRATNELGVFDGSLVYSWMDRRPQHEKNKLEYTRSCANELYQFASRVFRTVNGEHRRRFLYTWDKVAFESLRAVARNWIYRAVKTAEEAFRFITEHAETLPVRKPFKIAVKREVVEVKKGEYTYLEPKGFEGFRLPKHKFKVGDSVKVIVEK